MYFVYIIECEDGSFYTGITTDLKRRFAEHRKGIGGGYTAAHKPKKIVYTERRKTRSAALKREAAIKRLRRAEKMELVGK